MEGRDWRKMKISKSKKGDERDTIERKKKNILENLWLRKNEN
jgi:hypothetical protein